MFGPVDFPGQGQRRSQWRGPMALWRCQWEIRKEAVGKPIYSSLNIRKQQKASLAFLERCLEDKSPSSQISETENVVRGAQIKSLRRGTTFALKHTPQKKKDLKNQTSPQGGWLKCPFFEIHNGSKKKDNFVATDKPAGWWANHIMSLSSWDSKAVTYWTLLKFKARMTAWLWQCSLAFGYFPVQRNGWDDLFQLFQVDADRALLVLEVSLVPFPFATLNVKRLPGLGWNMVQLVMKATPTRLLWGKDQSIGFPLCWFSSFSLKPSTFGILILRHTRLKQVLNRSFTRFSGSKRFSFARRV